MVKVLNAGIFTTVQDVGRFGQQEFGVPYSGVMDLYAAKMVNALLGNRENDAVVEMAMVGPKFQFGCDTYICISGAQMNPKLNKSPISNNKIIAVKQNDVLSFGKLEMGFRAYLGILGGFKTEVVMQSRSMYQGITKNHILEKNDVLPIEDSPFKSLKKHAKIKVDKNYLINETIEVRQGPEFNTLSKAQQKQLLTQNFTISKNNNRMAYQLLESIENQLQPIITSAVMPGTVQLTPSGQLIILMRDCQTTGGYPRIFQLTESALNVLSQKFTGQNIGFNLMNSKAF